MASSAGQHGGFAEQKEEGEPTEDEDDSRIVSSKGAFDVPISNGKRAAEFLASAIPAATHGHASGPVIIDGDVRRPVDDAPEDEEKTSGENAAAELCFHEGTKAHARGRPDDAVKQFNYAIGLDPTQPHYYHHLAHSLQEMDRLDESVVAYEAMLDLDGSNYDGWYDMGYIQQQLGKSGDAADSFTRALELNPQDKDALIFLGMCFMTEGKYASAINTYKKALDIDPSCVTSHYNLGTAYLNAKDESNRLAEDYHRAGHHFHEAIKVHPDYADAYFNLALCYQGCGEHQDALDTFNHALELQPDMHEAREAVDAIRQEMHREKANRQRQLEEERSAVHIAHGQRLLSSPASTGTNDKPSSSTATVSNQGIVTSAAKSMIDPNENRQESDASRLQRELDRERARAKKLEEDLRSQTQKHDDQLRVMRETQASNDRLSSHREELEGLKQAKASQNHATEVEIRMQKLLADFRTLQTQHEALLRGKQQLQRNHDALVEANRNEKATTAQFRDQLSHGQAEINSLRSVSDAQHREITRLRKLESELQHVKEQHAQGSTLAQNLEKEKRDAVATLSSVEKQHRQKVQEMVQSYAESSKRLQLLEENTRQDSNSKIVAMRSDHAMAISTLKSAHAIELQQIQATHADVISKTTEKLRSGRLRGILHKWMGKEQHRAWNAWKLVCVAHRLRSEHAMTADVLEAKHKSASQETVESHKVATTRALLEKERVIADQQVSLEARSQEKDAIEQNHRRSLVKAAIVRMMRARASKGWNAWRLLLAGSQAKASASEDLAALGNKVADLEGERTRLQSDHDTLDAHRKKLISSHSSLQQELKLLAADKEIVESGHKTEMAELRQQLETLITERSALSGGLTSLKTESEESVAGLEGKVAAMHIELQKLSSEKATAQQQREDLLTKLSSLEAQFAATKADADLQVSGLQNTVAALEKQRQSLLDQSSAANVEVLNLRSESELVRSKHEALLSAQEESKSSQHGDIAAWKEERERLLAIHENEVAQMRKSHSAVSEMLATEIAGLRQALAERDTMHEFKGDAKDGPSRHRAPEMGLESKMAWTSHEVIEPGSHAEADAPASTGRSPLLSPARTSKLPMLAEDHMEAVEMPDSPQQSTPEPPRGVSVMPHVPLMIDLDRGLAPPTPPVDALTSVYDALAAAERVAGVNNAAHDGVFDNKNGGIDTEREDETGMTGKQSETYHVTFPTGNAPLGIEIDSPDEDSLPVIMANTTGNPLPRVGDLIVGVGTASLVGLRDPKTRLAELVGMHSQNVGTGHGLILEFRRTMAGTANEKQAWLDSLPKTDDESACQNLRDALLQSASDEYWTGPVALWDGVTIDTVSSRVTSINLHAWGLKISLSSLATALGAFPDLNELVLDNNPGVRGTLSDLQVIPQLCDLSIDACAGISGDISSIGRTLKNLTALDLTNCASITGDLRSIISLSGLRLLCVGDTHLTGSLTCLRNMVELRHLDLHKVAVSGNINVLSGLRNLETCTITSSRVNGRLGNIGNLTNMQVLTLSGTRVEGNISVIGKFASLVKLEVEGCSKIEGTLRDLQKAGKLEEICLQATAVRGNLGDLESLMELTNINIKGCKNITGSLLMAARFPKLQHLNISATRIRYSQRERAAFDAETAKGRGAEVKLVL